MLTKSSKQSRIFITVEETDFLFCKQKPFSMREEIPFLQLFAERGLFLLEVSMPYIKGHKQPEEVKRKIGEANKGNIPWNKGKKNVCSKEVRKINSEAHKGSKNHFWKDGIKHSSSGYIYIYKPEHPFCINKKYVLKHRLVMEKHLKRYLKPEDIVHHKGIKYPLGSIENKQDNRIENLMLFPNTGEHVKFHFSIRRKKAFSYNL